MQADGSEGHGATVIEAVTDERQSLWSFLEHTAHNSRVAMVDVVARYMKWQRAEILAALRAGTR